jgi:hypothetical protein
MLVEFLSIILNFKYALQDWKQLPQVTEKLDHVKLFCMVHAAINFKTYLVIGMYSIS